ncbi:MAG TPA: hypothetical protein VE999_05170 [Gemmataceae bacterium]|nr:hypothetical protein [Gemmataceae bacterium]
MFDWLFEGRTGVYAVLAALVVFLLVIWWQTRKRWLLLGVAVAVALIGLYALLDKVVETDREQIVRKVNEMAAAVNSRNLDALFENISENFRSPLGKDKQQFRDFVGHYVNGGIVQNVRVWDIEFDDSPSRENPPARVFFRARAEENGRGLFADCETMWGFDSQHGWRLRSIRLFKPQTTEEWPIQL